MTCESVLMDTSQDSLRVNDTENVCSGTNKMKKSSAYIYVFGLVLHYYVKWLGLESLSKKQELGLIRRKEVDVQKNKVFAMEQTTLFYTQCHNCYQQSQKDKPLEYSSGKDRAFHF